MVHCPHREKTNKCLSQSAVPVAPNSFLLAHTWQKQRTYPAKDVVPTIMPEDYWLSSQTQFQQFLHTTTNQGMDYCLKNMETTKTLQKIKGWSEPVPSHSPKDHTQARKHQRYVQETKPFTHQRDSKILTKTDNGKHFTCKFLLNYQQS